MTLIQRVRRSFRLLEQQQTLINAQQRLIDDMLQELRRAKLEHAREMHGLVSAWRIHMETPEVDLRDDMQVLVRSPRSRNT